MGSSEWNRGSSSALVAGAIGSALGAGPVIFYVLPLLMGPITTEFGWSRGGFSVVMAIASTLVAVTSPTLGRMTDRWGARAVMLPGILLFGVANYGLSFANGSLTQWYLLWVPIGLGAAVVGPVAYSKVISGWFHRRRGLALGLSLGVGGGLGGALMPQFVGALVRDYGWRTAYLGMSAAIIVISLPVAYFLLIEPTKARLAERAAVDPTFGVTGAEARRTGVLWAILAIQLLAAISVTGVIGHSVPFLTDHGISPAIGATVLSVAGISTVFGRIISGYFLDRIDSPKVSVVFFLSPLLGTLLLQYGTTTPVLLAAGITLGLGLGAEGEIIGYYVSRYFGLRAFAQIYGYTYAIFVVGAGMGPFLMGVTYDAIHSYQVILTVFETALAIACVGVLLLPPYVYKPIGSREPNTTLREAAV
jgi:MFS family permease